MILRQKIVRGETYPLRDGGQAVGIEDIGGNQVKVLVNGILTTLPKDALDLPVIDTAFYEKIK